MFRLFLIIYLYQIILNTELNICISEEKCADCLKKSSDCAWCKNKDWADYRCNNLKTLTSQGCQQIDIINDPSSFTVSEVNDNNFLKITPAKINAVLRPNGFVEFDVNIEVLKYKDVHLGIVMDNSFSMINVIENLKILSANLANLGQGKTFKKVGVSQFIDKIGVPVMDMAYYSKLSEINKPFNYRIVHPLTDRSGVIKDALEKTNISGNVDTWEDAFNGIVQTVVCDQFGWENNDNILRAIIVFTDALPKIVTGGMILGIYTPNDMKCHLDSNLADLLGLDQDYHSIGQVGYVLRQNKTEIIFAVPKEIQDTYKKIVDSWKGVRSTVVDLDTKQSQIEQLLEKSRADLNSRLEIFYPDTKDLMITTTPQRSCPIIENNVCGGVKVKGKYAFKVKVVALNITQSNKIEFSVSNLGKFELSYKSFDSCNCNDADVNTRCAKGIFKCGICECPKNFGGVLCECDLSNKDVTQCTNSLTGAVCSNNGICTACSTCSCFTSTDKKRYTGNFCECGRTNCKIFNNEVCGGANRGKCTCNDCECTDDYFGSACENQKCESKEVMDKCKQKDSDKECSGFGKCNCGKCTCIDSREGDWCEQTATKIDCDYFKKDVMCFVSNKETLSSNTCPQSINTIQYLEESVYSCVRISDDKCKIFFNFIKQNTENVENVAYTINVKKIDLENDCEKPINVIYVAIGALGGILVLGILLFMVYFICLYFYYKAEFKKFQKEIHQQSEGQQNPLFENTTER